MIQRKIGNCQFNNPILTASGTFGMGEPFADFVDYSVFGGIILKTVTPKMRKGNPPPRIYETPCGLLNSIGLENDGADTTYEKLKSSSFLDSLPTKVIFSVAGDEIKDYQNMVQQFQGLESIDLFEINLSCPNVHAGGNTFCSNLNDIEKVVKSIKEISVKPIVIKLSPNSGDIAQKAKVSEDFGADAVTISNTFLGMAIDLKTRKPLFKNIVAGFSGPAVKPIALYQVYKTAQITKIPIIASGGIASGEDAQEFLLAGASFVTLGTFQFVEPKIVYQILDYLEKYDKMNE